MIKRFTQRRLEFEDNIGSLRKLEEQGLIRIEDGLIIDTGLYGGTGKSITGDYDLFQIVGLDGRPVSPEKYRQVLDALKADPDRLVVHGAHMRWPEDAPFGRGSKEAGIFDAIMAGHEHEALLMLGGFSDGLVRTTYVRQIGDGRELITTHDGTVLWGGGFLMRPSPLETAAHQGPLTLDKVLAAGSLLRRIKPAYLAADQQGAAAPPEAVSAPTPAGEMTPEEKARYRDEQDELMFATVEQNLPPEFSGDPSLFGDEEAPDPSDRPPALDALSDEPWLDDTVSLRPVDDPASYDDGGSYADLFADHRVVAECDQCAPTAHDLTMARTQVTVLEADVARLQHLLDEHGDRSDEIEPALHEASVMLDRARREVSIRAFILEECEQTCEPALPFDPWRRAADVDDDIVPSRTAPLSAPETDCCEACREEAVALRFAQSRLNNLRFARPPVADRAYDLAIEQARKEYDAAQHRLNLCTYLLCTDDFSQLYASELGRPPGYEQYERVSDCPECQQICRMLAANLGLADYWAKRALDEGATAEGAESMAAAERCRSSAAYLEELLERCERERCLDSLSDSVRSHLPETADAPIPPTAGKSKRRLPAIIAGAVGAAVAGGVAVVALIGSGNDPSATLPTPAPPSQQLAVDENPDAQVPAVEANPDAQAPAVVEVADDPAPAIAGPPKLISEIAGPNGTSIRVLEDAEGGLSWSIVGADGQPLPSSEIDEYWSTIVTYVNEAVDRMFNFSSYPCGAVTDEFRVTCPLGAGILAEGEYIVVGATLAGPIGEGARSFTYGSGVRRRRRRQRQLPVRGAVQRRLLPQHRVLVPARDRCRRQPHDVGRWSPRRCPRLPTVLVSDGDRVRRHTGMDHPPR